MSQQRIAFTEATGYRTIFTYLEDGIRKEWSTERLNVVRAKELFQRQMERRQVRVVHTRIHRGL